MSKFELLSLTATITTILVITYLFLSSLLVSVSASRVEKITWCHCEPNGNCETLELPQQALEQAGHMDASGSPLHAGDHAGECVGPTPTIIDATGTPTPTIEITATPDLSPSPTAGVSATLVPTEVPTPEPSQPAPAAPPEWSDPCFYLQGHAECLPKSQIFPGEGQVFGAQK